MSQSEINDFKFHKANHPAVEELGGWAANDEFTQALYDAIHSDSEQTGDSSDVAQIEDRVATANSIKTDIFNGEPSKEDELVGDIEVQPCEEVPRRRRVGTKAAKKAGLESRPLYLRAKELVTEANQGDENADIALEKIDSGKQDITTAHLWWKEATAESRDEFDRLSANAKEALRAAEATILPSRRIACVDAILKAIEEGDSQTHREILDEASGRLSKLSDPSALNKDELRDTIAQEVGIGSDSTYNRLNKIKTASEQGDENAEKILQAVDAGKIGIKPALDEWRTSLETEWDAKAFLDRTVDQNLYNSTIRKSDNPPSYDISWADSLVEVAIGIQAYWNEILEQDGVPSQTVVSKGLEDSTTSEGFSPSTVSRLIEPLRPRWSGTVVDPNNNSDSDVSIDLDRVGSHALTYIGRLDASKDERIQLLRRAEEGLEHRRSIADLRDSDQTVGEYLNSVSEVSE
jgi:hypothetical protein